MPPTPAATRPQGFRAGAKAALPLCVALVAFGMSFGVLARANGFGVVAPLLMSLTTFTGASQFAVVSILGQAAGSAQRWSRPCSWPRAISPLG